MVVVPSLYSGFPKELPNAAGGEIQKIVNYGKLKLEAEGGEFRNAGENMFVESEILFY